MASALPRIIHIKITVKTNTRQENSTNGYMNPWLLICQVCDNRGEVLHVLVKHDQVGDAIFLTGLS